MPPQHCPRPCFHPATPLTRGHPISWTNRDVCYRSARQQALVLKPRDESLKERMVRIIPFYPRVFFFIFPTPQRRHARYWPSLPFADIRSVRVAKVASGQPHTRATTWPQDTHLFGAHVHRWARPVDHGAVHRLSRRSVDLGNAGERNEVDDVTCTHATSGHHHDLTTVNRTTFMCASMCLCAGVSVCLCGCELVSVDTRAHTHSVLWGSSPHTDKGFETRRAQQSVPTCGVIASAAWTSARMVVAPSSAVAACAQERVHRTVSTVNHEQGHDIARDTHTWPEVNTRSTPCRWHSCSASTASRHTCRPHT